MLCSLGPSAPWSPVRPAGPVRQAATPAAWGPPGRRAGFFCSLVLDSYGLCHSTPDPDPLGNSRGPDDIFSGGWGQGERQRELPAPHALVPCGLTLPVPQGGQAGHVSVTKTAVTVPGWRRSCLWETQPPGRPSVEACWAHGPPGAMETLGDSSGDLRNTLHAQTCFDPDSPVGCGAKDAVSEFLQQRGTRGVGAPRAPAAGSSPAAAGGHHDLGNLFTHHTADQTPGSVPMFCSLNENPFATCKVTWCWAPNLQRPPLPRPQPCR